MKLIFKISVMLMFILIGVSSCEKQRNVCPVDKQSTESSVSSQKTGVKTETNDGQGGVIKSAEKTVENGDVVGGGDDDRDGGEKKPKKLN